MKKKWIILAVILVLTLTLAMGCGKDKNNSTSDNSAMRDNTVADTRVGDMYRDNTVADRARTDAAEGRAEIRNDMQDLRQDIRDTVVDTVDPDNNSRLNQNAIDNNNVVDNEVGWTGNGIFGLRR